MDPSLGASGTMVVEDPLQPRGGRIHRIGLCTEDAAAMLLGEKVARIRAALFLQRPIPELKADIVPLLRLKAPDIPGIIELLCSQELAVAAANALEAGLRPLESGRLLRALRDQVVIYWDSLELPEIALCFWSLADTMLLSEPLQAAASMLSWKVLRRGKGPETSPAHARSFPEKRPLFIAPRPFQLLRRLSAEEEPGVADEVSRDVYAFAALTVEFCDLFLQELSWFERSGFRRSRPNSMNTYGTVLEEMDLGLSIAEFQRQVLLPLSRLLFPGLALWAGGKWAVIFKGKKGEGKPLKLAKHAASADALAGLGDELDNHHAFVIRYGVSGAADMDLAPHRDDSEVTFNMALGRSWRGCDLNFCGRMQEKDVHQHRLSHRFPGLSADVCGRLLG
eukprot:Skav232672  [mRNA]  locus=scaffold698:249808:262792:+ [translate_table: standard]